MSLLSWNSKSLGCENTTAVTVFIVIINCLGSGALMVWFLKQAPGLHHWQRGGGAGRCGCSGTGPGDGDRDVREGSWQ